MNTMSTCRTSGLALKGGPITHLHMESKHFHEKDNNILDTPWIFQDLNGYGHDMLHKARKQSWLNANTKGHFTQKPRAVTKKLWEPERKCPKAISRHLKFVSITSMVKRCHLFDHNHDIYIYIYRHSNKLLNRTKLFGMILGGFNLAFMANMHWRLIVWSTRNWMFCVY